MVLTKRERSELTRRARSRTGRAETARRARVILLLAEGRTWDARAEIRVRSCSVQSMNQTVGP
ncbi:MAG: hypothetical protein OJF50_003932 [Nitrospira sp.]|nr:hypothetical protein [Nitrospira sp.]